MAAVESSEVVPVVQVESSSSAPISIISLIKKKLSCFDDEPLLVFIDGCVACGKTTMMKNLFVELNAQDILTACVLEPEYMWWHDLIARSKNVGGEMRDPSLDKTAFETYKFQTMCFADEKYMNCTRPRVILVERSPWSHWFLWGHRYAIGVYWAKMRQVFSLAQILFIEIGIQLTDTTIVETAAKRNDAWMTWAPNESTVARLQERTTKMVNGMAGLWPTYVVDAEARSQTQLASIDTMVRLASTAHYMPRDSEHHEMTHIEVKACRGEGLEEVDGRESSPPPAKRTNMTVTRPFKRHLNKN